MTLNVEIGGRGRRGWLQLDHDKKYADKHIDIMFDDLPLDDNSVDRFCMAHVIEHIPFVKSHEVLKKVYNKLKPNGSLRLATPDLKQFCAAYINGDKDWLKKYGPRTQLYQNTGIGGLLMQVIVSYGADGDTFLFDKTKNKEIIALAHVMLYDVEMITSVLKDCGFVNIRQVPFNKGFDTQTEESQIIVECSK